MAEPTRPDPFATPIQFANMDLTPIQLANMDLDPVRNVAKSTLVDVELVVTSVRTGPANVSGSVLFLLQTEIQDLNDKLGELGFGDAPHAVVFDGETKNAAIGLGLINGAAGSIREKLKAGGLVADLESLEDEARLLKKGLQLLGDNHVGLDAFTAVGLFDIQLNTASRIVRRGNSEAPFKNNVVAWRVFVHLCYSQGCVIEYGALQKAGWGVDDSDNRENLQVEVTRIRKLIVDLRLGIDVVRESGYQLVDN